MSTEKMPKRMGKGFDFTADVFVAVSPSVLSKTRQETADGMPKCKTKCARG
jgi:hypothetical protein